MGFLPIGVFPKCLQLLKQARTKATNWVLGPGGRSKAVAPVLLLCPRVHVCRKLGLGPSWHTGVGCQATSLPLLVGSFQDLYLCLTLHFSYELCS